MAVKIFMNPNILIENGAVLPITGFGIFSVVALCYLFREKHTLSFVIVMCVILGCNSILAFRRNRVWKDEYTLY